jgi:lipopolysaccharide export system permease protein
VVNTSTSQAYEPLLRDNIFRRDIQVTQIPDSLRIVKSKFIDVSLLDTIANLSVRAKSSVWGIAHADAVESRNSFSFDETMSKDALTQLYKSKNDWHRKLAIPVSVIIFFLIGAPLGAIIRKGGLGTPIVISVAFFVIYYIITLTGEKASVEGQWSAVMGMWISTFVLSPIAIYLLIKATNDSSLLDTEWYWAKYQKMREKIAPIITPVRNRITSSAAWRWLSGVVSRIRLKRTKKNVA